MWLRHTNLTDSRPVTTIISFLMTTMTVVTLATSQGSRQQGLHAGNKSGHYVMNALQG
jgi:hypothetical protein